MQRYPRNFIYLHFYNYPWGVLWRFCVIILSSFFAMTCSDHRSELPVISRFRSAPQIDGIVL